MESDQRSSFLFGRIFFDEPASTSSENAFWFGRIFFDEPLHTSSENALGFGVTLRWVQYSSAR